MLGEFFVPSPGPGGGGDGSQQVRTTPLGSGVTFSISNPVVTGNNGNQYAQDEANLPDNLFTSSNVTFGAGGSLTFTFSGLMAGSAYNLALYAGDLGHRSGDDPVHFTINGLAVTPVGPVNGMGAFILNTAASPGNYEIIPARADGNGAITIVGSDAPGGNGYVKISGFGIASAPEPSTRACLLGGLGVLVGFNRMRRQA